MKKLIGLMACIMLLGLSSVFAQSKQVTGVVTDMSGLGLPGVSVSIKGTTDGTNTDIDGKWALNAKPTDVIVVSFVGMKTQNIKVGNKTTFKIKLEENRVAVDEVMVVAYGTAKKSSFTGSASVVNREQIEKIQVADPTQALEGLATGVQITSGSGQPGSSPKIRIRGVGSINASSDPLIVVDGFPFAGKMNSIASSDIESMTVLKDAAATSLYGSRAANGVIIITTKQGKAGESQFDVKWTTGLSSRAYPEYDRVSSGEYYETMWRKNYNVNGNDAAAATNGLISAVGGYNIYKGVADNEIIGADGNLTAKARAAQKNWNDDWSDELIRSVAKRNNIVVSASGGTDKSKYYVSTNILDEDGLVTNSNFKRYSARANVTSQMRDWIKINLGMSASTSEQNSPKSDGNSYVNSFMFTRFIAPIYPVYLYDAAGKRQYESNGSSKFDYGNSYGRKRSYAVNSNPLGVINLDQKVYTRDNVSARGGVQFSFLKDFKLDIKGSGDYYSFSGLENQNKNYGDAKQYNGRTTKTSDRTFRFMSNQILSWSKEFKEHSFNVLVGHESEFFRYNTFEAVRTGFPFAGALELDAAAVMEGSSSHEDNLRVESYLSRVQYDYDDKYYLSGSFRSDASSRFHPDNRTGYFWSIGGSWRMSQEEFIKDISFISNLKLKASYGVTGNDNLGTYYAYQGLYALGNNNNEAAGTIAYRLPTPDLSWEKNASLNLGFEASFVDSRYSIAFEWYSRESKDLLFSDPLSPSTGFSSIYNNIGSIKNSGIEVDLGAAILRDGDFKWNVSMNISAFKNEITELPKNSMMSGLKRWEVGKSIYDFYIQDFAGVNVKTGKSEWYYRENVKNADGSIKVDKNGEAVKTGDKKKTSNYAQADKYFSGTSIPDLTGGFTNNISYKGFDFSFVFAFGLGGKIYDASYSALMHGGNTAGQTWHSDILNSWKKVGDVTNVPVVDADETTNSTSTRFLIDADYLKLKNISLGYTLPSYISSKMKLKMLKLFVSADNLWLLSKREGLDPQQSLDGTTDNVYSPVRTISLGINIKF